MAALSTFSAASLLTALVSMATGTASLLEVPVSEPARVPVHSVRVRPAEHAAKKERAIHLNLSDQRAILKEDGVAVAVFPISSGAPSTPTPVGTFQIHSKQLLRISGQDLPYRMPYYMAFTKDAAYGLHALPYLGNSAEDSYYWQEANEHIGTPVSHGCVRFLPEHALQIYRWAKVGTTVHIER